MRVKRPRVDGGLFQDLAVTPAGNDLAAVCLAKLHGDHRLAIDVEELPGGRGGEAVDAHLAQRVGGPPAVRAPVVHGPVHQIEDLSAQRLGIPLVGGKVGLRLAGLRSSDAFSSCRTPRPGRAMPGPARCGTASFHREFAVEHDLEAEGLGPGSGSPCSSAIRLSRAGIPMIFSCAFRPSSPSPSRLSIFQ